MIPRFSNETRGLICWHRTPAMLISLVCRAAFLHFHALEAVVTLVMFPSLLSWQLITRCCICHRPVPQRLAPHR